MKMTRILIERLNCQNLLMSVLILNPQNDSKIMFFLKPVGFNEGRIVGLVEVRRVGDGEECEEVGEHREDKTQDYDWVATSPESIYILKCMFSSAT